VPSADAIEGHIGYVYQATNFLYYGMTEDVWFYRDTEGRLRHPRQNGVNISCERAIEMGWTRERREAKHRYVLILEPPSGERIGKRKWKQQTQALFTPEFARLIQDTYPKKPILSADA
jgi:hypothetical protein